MLRLAILRFVAACSTPAPAPSTPPPAPASASSWSASVEGLRGRLVVKEPTVDPEANRPHTAHITLELENVSDVGNPIGIRWDPDELLAFTLTDAGDAKGQTIEPHAVPTSIAMPQPHWQAVPYHSTLAIDLTTYGYGVMPAPGIVLGLPHGAFWQFAANDLGTRRLSATFTVASDDPKRPVEMQGWEGTLRLPAIDVL